MGWINKEGSIASFKKGGKVKETYKKSKKVKKGYGSNPDRKTEGLTTNFPHSDKNLSPAEWEAIKERLDSARRKEELLKFTHQKRKKKSKK